MNNPPSSSDPSNEQSPDTAHLAEDTSLDHPSKEPLFESAPTLDDDYPVFARARPACTKPARIQLVERDLGPVNIREIKFFFDEAAEAPGESFSLPSFTYYPDHCLPFPLLERLARGEAVPTLHPSNKTPVAGVLRMLWWVPGPNDVSPRWKYNSILLDFVPDDGVPQDLDFEQWDELRHPHLSYDHSPGSEAYLLYLHTLWRQEVAVPPTLQPDDDLLYKAVVENFEILAGDILQDRRIVVDPARIGAIHETALGVSMENQGSLGLGPGFMGGCHRDYREDDFCSAEDPDTWIPRASRIEQKLRDAGAVDYLPIIHACHRGNLEEVRALLDAGYPPTFTVYGYSTPLCEAAAGKHVEICRLLLERGADPNQPRPFNSSMCSGGQIYPLALALDNPPLFRLLVDAGANVHECGDDGDMTPLLFKGDYETAENAAAVFEKIDFASIRSSEGLTGVHCLRTNDLALCRRFIPRELLDTPDHSGCTPLVAALMKNDFEKAALLLSMGASIEARSWVHRIGSWEMADLSSYPPLLITPPQAALLAGSVDLLGAMLARDAHPDPTAYGMKEGADLSETTLKDLHRRFQEDTEIHQTRPSHYNRIHLPFPLKDAIEKAVGDFIMEYPHLSTDPEKYRMRYPELISQIDIVELARNCRHVRQEVLTMWQSGRCLTASEWLQLCADTLSEVEGEVGEFARVLAAFDPEAPEAPNAPEEEDREYPSAMTMLLTIDQAAGYLDRARTLIEGQAPEPRFLSSEILARASSEFDGGNARALKSAARGEGVSVDDFLDALQEAAKPGSTTDHGKVLQVTRQVVAQLDQECISWMRRV